MKVPASMGEGIFENPDYASQNLRQCLRLTCGKREKMSKELGSVSIFAPLYGLVLSEYTFFLPAL